MQELANYGCGPNIAHCLIFTNKVVLKHSHVHSFMYDLGLLSCSGSKDEQLLQRTSGPQSQTHLLHNALHKKTKNLLTPGQAH